jgi:hypothetical protein
LIRMVLITRVVSNYQIALILFRKYRLRQMALKKLLERKNPPAKFSAQPNVVLVPLMLVKH